MWHVESACESTLEARNITRIPPLWHPSGPIRN
jgi:hypothetical protein